MVEKNDGCELCKINERMVEIIKRRDPDEMASFIKELAVMWLNADQDRNYYSSIIDGSWPQAVEILTTSLEKSKNYQNRDLNHDVK
jgi:hypothetical protein